MAKELNVDDTSSIWIKKQVIGTYISPLNIEYTIGIGIRGHVLRVPCKQRVKEIKPSMFKTTSRAWSRKLRMTPSMEQNWQWQCHDPRLGTWFNETSFVLFLIFQFAWHIQIANVQRLKSALRRFYFRSSPVWASVPVVKLHEGHVGVDRSVGATGLWTQTCRIESCFWAISPKRTSCKSYWQHMLPKSNCPLHTDSS